MGVIEGVRGLLYVGSASGADMARPGPTAKGGLIQVLNYCFSAELERLSEVATSQLAGLSGKGPAAVDLATRTAIPSGAADCWRAYGDSTSDIAVPSVPRRRLSRRVLRPPGTAYRHRPGLGPTSRGLRQRPQTFAHGRLLRYED